ncbi:hypothetical protein P152DRAFT_517497 [Eremomyces bilateralis CBS 781.70]|uniref:VOC domain-containing protein n=1 Tax=Eremomyces bilateralis CBS 781.70 TaxID=1392243 RepID=A0A6G1FRW8_9PEZI|nr:uncharacterized protein P152DRAFT_517497 [Eremomyces bilateralis CBS 781.70]KAF1808478.1 hypothetical protein P152DRAFT_517497 [Eremomyces bilateralis CBS 781.70]
MPLAHVAVIVSNLHQASYFYLSALQPLGYCIVEQRNHEIAMGIHEPEFWLIEQSPGLVPRTYHPTTTHIAVSSPSRTIVRTFYAAALSCHGTPYAAPAYRNHDADFNAAIIDLDGNTLEVVHQLPVPGHDAEQPSTAGTVVGSETGSRVLNWRNSVAESVSDRDAGTVVSRRTSRPAPSVSVSKRSSPASVAASKVSSPASVTAAPAPAATEGEPPANRSLTGDVLDLVTTAFNATSIAPKTIAGTLLGAAAGAAVAYAMVRSEEDSAQKEAIFEAKMEAQQQRTAELRQKAGRVLARAATVATVPTTGRGGDAGSRAGTGFVVGEVDAEADGQRAAWREPIRMIEAPPMRVEGVESYFPQGRSGWDEGRSTASSRLTARRVNSMPVDPMAYQYPPIAALPPPPSNPRAAWASTVAPTHKSHRKDSVVGPPSYMYPPPVENGAEPVLSLPPPAPSHNSSKQPSREPQASSSSSTSRKGKSQSKAASSHHRREKEEPLASDNDTVAPSDSISMVGSSHSRHSKHSKTSATSKHSKHSKHSKASKRSSHSRHSKRESSASREEDERSVSTVKPVRRSASEQGREREARASRKGSVVTLPEGRAKEEKKKARRSVVSFVDGARLW